VEPAPSRTQLDRATQLRNRAPGGKRRDDRVSRHDFIRLSSRKPCRPSTRSLMNLRCLAPEKATGNYLNRKSCPWSSRETGHEFHGWHNPRQTTARIDSHGRLNSSTGQPIDNLECLPNGNDSLETVARYRRGPLRRQPQSVRPCWPSSTSTLWCFPHGQRCGGQIGFVGDKPVADGEVIRWRSNKSGLAWLRGPEGT
jgi:hypothetical protein